MHGTILTHVHADNLCRFAAHTILVSHKVTNQVLNKINLRVKMKSAVDFSDEYNV